MKTSEVLVKALELLREGRGWNNYTLHTAQDTYCALGAIQKVELGHCTASYDQRYPAAQMLIRAIGGREITGWNDNHDWDGFPKIKAGFCAAIKLALAEEGGTDESQ